LPALPQGSGAQPQPLPDLELLRQTQIHVNHAWTLKNTHAATAEPASVFGAAARPQLTLRLRTQGKHKEKRNLPLRLSVWMVDH
jgi:hypothetical protein